MKGKTKKQKSWTERLRSHRENCIIVLEELRELNRIYQNGMDVQRLLQHVIKTMEQIQTEADRLHGEVCIVPLRMMFSANRVKITKHQYWLIRATGFEMFTAKKLGICPVDDYDVYKNCLYKDNGRVCFICPDKMPAMETVNKKTGGTRLRRRIACSPEETALQYYRPEQKRFFSKYRPDVLARAKKIQKS